MNIQLRPADDPRLEAIAEFSVGVDSNPCLADHGVQDLTVLPGACLIEMAFRLERELAGSPPRRMTDVTFKNAVVLQTEDTLIQVEVRELEKGLLEYTFLESGKEPNATEPSDRRQVARMVIHRTRRRKRTGRAGGSISIKEFQDRKGVVMTEGRRVYEMLRQNGNRYGPCFQCVSAIWKDGNRLLGKLSAPKGNSDGGRERLHPPLLDSMMQLLAPFVMERNKTIILRSIERIDFLDVKFPRSLWGSATALRRMDREGDSLRGNVKVFSPSGMHLKLSGIQFSLLNREEEDASAGHEEPLCIAANFTVEPIEESLKFWSHFFQVPVRLDFAPYNQVFQQLLDGNSLFHQHPDATRAVFLSLEEWVGNRTPLGSMPDPERLNVLFGERPRYRLPDTREIVHLNRYETDYLHREIFEDRCYLKHGIELKDGATVIDIGANIGMFTLFVLGQCKRPAIYACEPAPEVFDLLRANCDAHGDNVRALNVGVSSRSGAANFTYYEKSSVFSGFHSDESEDRAAVRTVVRNLLNQEPVEGDALEKYVDELTADRLQARTHRCRMTTVSEMIREYRIESIDLLKIDAEKSEWDILNGIAEEDWPKIRQIVVEIHDRSGEVVKAIEGVLCDRGFQCAVEHEKLLENSGLFNLFAIRSGARAPSRNVSPAFECDELEEQVRGVVNALKSYRSSNAAPVILCVCPPSPEAKRNAALNRALVHAEQTLLAEAGALPGVRTVDSASLQEWYPVREFHDPYGRELGHIPFTTEGFAALGTMLFRTVFNMKRRPYKVIAVDCDNSLWEGVCGEAGPEGVEVGNPHRKLQKFLIDQMRGGMLLCLCSKNNEADVWEVFDRNTGMELRREHLAAWRIDWNNKPENLKSLARELGVGLDSFIFLDDNPVECAEVRSRCPEVLALRIPREADSLPAFLHHVWAFDRQEVTSEDRSRTRMYRENRERIQFRERTGSLKEFIEGLDLQIRLSKPDDGQYARIAQLTQRTNQFNFTTLRRSEQEIHDFLRDEPARCLTVRVSDRFGDYGMAGVLLYELRGDRCRVDTFLLSCRVLGRGVEHAVVSELARRAEEEGAFRVEFTCHSTEKNRPARDFIARIGEGFRNAGTDTWTIPSALLAKVKYDPESSGPPSQKEFVPARKEAASAPSPWEDGSNKWPDKLQWIGEHLNDAGRIAAAAEQFRTGQLPEQNEDAQMSDGSIQSTVLGIWRRVLGRPDIGENDNFFDAGGTSLNAVRIVASINKALNRRLSAVSLFECPTVDSLSAHIEGKRGGGKTGDASEAGRRGHRRKIVKRRRAA